MKNFVPLLLLLSLSACATPEQIAARQAQQEKEDFMTCKSYGLRPGSEAFGMCRLQIDLAREQMYNSYYYAPPPRPYFDNSIYYLRH